MEGWGLRLEKLGFLHLKLPSNTGLVHAAARVTKQVTRSSENFKVIYAPKLAFNIAIFLTEIVKQLLKKSQDCA